MAAARRVDQNAKAFYNAARRLRMLVKETLVKALSPVVKTVEDVREA